MCSRPDEPPVAGCRWSAPRGGRKPSGVGARKRGFSTSSPSVATGTPATTVSCGAKTFEVVDRPPGHRVAVVEGQRRRHGAASSNVCGPDSVTRGFTSGGVSPFCDLEDQPAPADGCDVDRACLDVGGGIRQPQAIDRRLAQRLRLRRRPRRRPTPGARTPDRRRRSRAGRTGKPSGTAIAVARPSGRRRGGRGRAVRGQRRSGRPPPQHALSSPVTRERRPAVVAGDTHEASGRHRHVQRGAVHRPALPQPVEHPERIGEDQPGRAVGRDLDHARACEVARRESRAPADRRPPARPKSAVQSSEIRAARWRASTSAPADPAHFRPRLVFEHQKRRLAAVGIDQAQVSSRGWLLARDIRRSGTATNAPAAPSGTATSRR